MKKTTVGIVGGSGYTGSELLRLLVQHPYVDLVAMTSRTAVGTQIIEQFPHLKAHLSAQRLFIAPTDPQLMQCDLVFMATPSAIAMQLAPKLLGNGIKVIDLSADFRLKDPMQWAQWYGQDHQAPTWCEKAVYGLPEINREQIRTTQLVANPGCYPTAVSLGCLPALKYATSSQVWIADCKSAISGAGKSLKTPYLQAESAETFKAYGQTGHRHQPEILQTLQAADKNAPNLCFVPHLVPMIRGLYASIYMPIDVALEALHQHYCKVYESHPFVTVMAPNQSPETRSSRGTNYCQISVCEPYVKGYKLVLVAIDNLVKGAAGQAIQNLNLMQGYDEQTALTQVALVP